jgi:hypothetical protein
MPVFINEVVIRASVEPAPKGDPEDRALAGEPANRQALVEEVKQAIMDYLERELDRIGER